MSETTKAATGNGGQQQPGGVGNPTLPGLPGQWQDWSQFPGRPSWQSPKANPVARPE